MATTNPVVFLNEVKTELAKVIWPTKQETIKLTIIVIVISLIIGVYIGGIDFILTNITDFLLKR